MKWEWAVLLAVLAGLGIYLWYNAPGNGLDEDAMAAMDIATMEPAAGPVAELVSPTAVPGEVERLPNLGAVPGLTGIWAADATLCHNGAWHIEDTRVVTDGEMSCTVERVTSAEVSSTTLKVTMRCVAEGMSGAETWMIDTRTLGEGKLYISRNGLPAVPLLRCAPDAS